MNGNDFASKFFGKGKILRHKEFKYFVASRDPRMHMPPTNAHLNFKVDELFKCFNKVSLEACVHG